MIGIILITSILARIWYTLQPITLWWDAAMYIGLGKYIFTHGTLGILETFRPIGVSIILGFLWKLGLDPVVCGKILTIILSVAAVYGVYLIGERIQKYAGVYAATLLSFSAVFFAYSAAPLSDIPSVTLAIIALYAFINKKYYVSGLLTGAAFLTRFPMALMVISLTLSVFFVKEYLLKEKLYKILWIIGGFITVAIPYFIVNALVYGNPLLPIIVGSQVAEYAAKFYEPHSYFFYIHELCIENPFLIFALAAFIPFFISSQKQLRSLLIPIIIPLLLLGGYFTVNSHQELRYAISFLPFLCILAGFGITYATHLIPLKFKYTHQIGIVVVSVCLLLICSKAYELYSEKFKNTPELHRFHTYFNDKENVYIITTSPQMIAYSDIYLIDAFDTWEKANELYTLKKSLIDYIALNDCIMICNDPSTCPYAQADFFEKIAHDEIVFQTISRSCTLTIYKIK